MLTLRYRLGVTLAHLDLVILLDQRAARAPVRNAAVVEAAAFDLITLADLASLHQRVNPSATSEAGNEAVDHAVAVHHVGRLHRGISNPFGGLAEQDTWQTKSQQTACTWPTIA